MSHKGGQTSQSGQQAKSGQTSQVIPPGQTAPSPKGTGNK
jgi:hypothetical protein